MENEFIEIMTNNSDSELIKIVTTDRDKYKPDAIIAAEQEIENRNLSVERLEDAKSKVKEKETHLKNLENEPLGILQKILFFIFFWGIIPWMIAATYKADGAIRKYHEAWKSIKYGALTWLISTIIVLLIAYISFE